MIGNLLAGMLNKGAVLGDYESIATVTVGAGGQASIEFTSIPSTYQHLQLRGITLFSLGDRSADVILNNDSAANYAYHRLYGTGTSAVATAAANTTSMLVTQGSPSSGSVGGFILDVLDYTNTNKFKTIRDLSGTDQNGSGYIVFQSGLWRSTSAVNRIKLSPTGGSWNQHTHVALYGIKG